jgi:uncharacterized protein (DUF433 family)
MSVCGPFGYKYLADASANFPSNYRPAGSEVADSHLLPVFRRRFGARGKAGAWALCGRAVPALASRPSRKEAQVVTELNRITQNPKVMGGKPCIRGMRVTVGMIVGQIGAGRSIEEVLADYPYLEREDVLQALRYAAWRAEEREIAFA